jgi:hypothetical protein
MEFHVDRRMDGWPHMAELTVAFHNSMNAPKNRKSNIRNLTTTYKGQIPSTKYKWIKSGQQKLLQ